MATLQVANMTSKPLGALRHVRQQVEQKTEQTNVRDKLKIACEIAINWAIWIIQVASSAKHNFTHEGSLKDNNDHAKKNCVESYVKQIF